MTTTARFGRTSSRGLILGFSTPRVVALALAAVLLVAGLVMSGLVGATVTGLLWVPLLAAAFVQVQGQPAVEWTELAGVWEVRRMKGQDKYRAKPARPRPAGTLALPGDAASLRFYRDPATDAVMIHDPHRQTVTAAITVTHPAYVLLSPDDQDQRVAAWGRVLASLAHSGSVAAVQVLESTLPDTSGSIKRWYRDHMTGNTSSWFDAEYEALLTLLHTGGIRHQTTIAIALDMKAAAASIRDAGRGITGAAAVLGHEMIGLEQGLRTAGLHVERWLTSGEMAAMVRQAYDYASTVQPDDPGANLAHAGPLAVDEHWANFRSDSGWAAVLWVSEWPRIDVPPHFLHSLVFSPGVRKSISIVMTPLPTKVALRQIRKEKTEAVADAHQKAKIGQVADLSDAQEYVDLESRERALIQGHADVEFSGFIAVQAPTEQELTAAVSQIERAASQAACETRLLYGRQTQGFICAALPFARVPR